MKKTLIILGMACAIGTAVRGNPNLEAIIQSQYPNWETLYYHLHQNPELSNQEEKTSARLTKELEQRSFKVFRGIGGTGFAAVLKNGLGPTLLIRTDLDALPLKEKTSLPYASQVEVDGSGVMHACGHDVHMTHLIGVADTMAGLRDQWQGTLILIGQPAEEIGAGSSAMLEDGLFEKTDVPDYVLAIHVAGDLEAGKIGYRPGFMMANVDSVDIEITGKGGHGALPHMAIDPVVIASQIVLSLQTIVSRETDPLDSAVVTVGHITAGTKRNIIPDTALLQLTVRSYSDPTRRNVLSSIERIARHTALAAGVPEKDLPVVSTKETYTPALYNDPELTNRLVKVWKQNFGEDPLVLRSPEMIGEDFARFGRTPEQIPICMFRIGTGDGIISQSLHSPEFAPDPEPTIKGAVRAMTLAALDLLQP
ncbi:MAG: amidohydrolase [Verrucomicrobiae bacterium]|nr:amidohydrolase [Verrucomicrobiae bacterium]